MRLRLGVTKIGRGQNNDYFLDSSKLKNFISRYHAEVIGTKNENGQTEFVLTDKGLNGTFINDVRTKKTCILYDGDKITFGHTNGYKIQPGFSASQPESEFQFIFERIPKPGHTAELSSDNFNREESTDALHEQRKYSERTFLSDKNSNIQSPQITSTKDLQKDPESENEENENDKDIKSAVITKTDTTPKGSSKTSTTKDKKSLDISQEKVTKSVKQKTSSALAETLPAVEQDIDSHDSDNDDIKGKDSNDDKIESDENDDDKSDNDGKDEGDGDGGKFEEEDDDIESEKEIKSKKPAKKKKRVRTGFTKPKPKPKPKEKEDVISFSDDSSEDEEPPKPAPKGQRSRKKSGGSSNTASTSNKGKNSRKRKDSGGQSKQTDLKRRKTRGGGGNGGGKKETGGDDKELSDGVEWYEEDTCEATTCKRPKNKRTPWVQCDDCDGWYHTVCVGANYRQVKDDNASFSCGCT